MDHDWQYLNFRVSVAEAQICALDTLSLRDRVLCLLNELEAEPNRSSITLPELSTLKAVEENAEDPLLRYGIRRAVVALLLKAGNLAASVPFLSEFGTEFAPFNVLFFIRNEKSRRIYHAHICDHEHFQEVTFYSCRLPTIPFMPW